MSKRVLLVEDDNGIVAMYQMQLKMAGYTVFIARNGVEGLEKAEAEKPDLIMLDLRMPVMSGDVMLQKLREEEWGQDIPVICLTNISRDEAPRNLRFLNVEHFIVKALHTPSQVIEIVNDVFKELDYHKQYNK